MIVSSVNTKNRIKAKIEGLNEKIDAKLNEEVEDYDIDLRAMKQKKAESKRAQKRHLKSQILNICFASLFSIVSIATMPIMGPLGALMVTAIAWGAFGTGAYFAHKDVVEKGKEVQMLDTAIAGSKFEPSDELKVLESERNKLMEQYKEVLAAERKAQQKKTKKAGKEKKSVNKTAKEEEKQA